MPDEVEKGGGAIPEGPMQISLLTDHPNESINIAQWYYDEWLSSTPNVTVSRIAKKISKSINRTNVPLMVLSHIDKELAGVIELNCHENIKYPDYQYWLAGLYVHPTYRGRGVSHSLITELLKHTVRLGVSKLYLECESNYIALYEKHGFSVLHRARHGDTFVTIMFQSLKIDIYG